MLLLRPHDQRDKGWVLFVARRVSGRCVVCVFCQCGCERIVLFVERVFVSCRGSVLACMCVGCGSARCQFPIVCKCVCTDVSMVWDCQCQGGKGYH